MKVCVSHYGINSTHESLHAGTPIVGIPMLADQRAGGVRRAGDLIEGAAGILPLA